MADRFWVNPDHYNRLLRRAAAYRAVLHDHGVTREDDLKVALDLALDLAAEGWAYASEYFVEKWAFQERPDALQSVADGLDVPRKENLELFSQWPYPGWREADGPATVLEQRDESSVE